MIPKFQGEVHFGEVQLYDQEAYKDYVASLEGKKVTVSVKKFTKTRTRPQECYYWGVVVESVRVEMGELTRDEVHEFLKEKFLKEKRIIATEKTIVEVNIIRSTTSLTTVEYEDFLSKIRTWASIELRCYIPLPNEVEVPNYY